MADNRDTLVDLFKTIDNVTRGADYTADLPSWFPQTPITYLAFRCFLNDKNNVEIFTQIFLREDVYSNPDYNAAIVANMKRYVEFRYNGGTPDDYNAQFPNIDYTVAP
jgi:hypothetical protein